MHDELLRTVRETLTGPATMSDIVKLGNRLLKTSPPANAPAQRIALIGNETLDHIACAIACAVASENVWPILYQAPYGTWIQQALDRHSELYQFAPQLVVLATDWRTQVEDLAPATPSDQVAAAVAQRAALNQRVWANLETIPGCRLLQHILPMPQYAGRGVATRLDPASHRNQVAALNHDLLAAGTGRITWIDIDRLANLAGQRRWSPDRLYFDAKLDFDPRNLGAYLAAFAGAWRSACAKSKKVLALDLDNTLWGGVIGDDGVDNIVLGSSTPEGEAFEAWQRYLKTLSREGVILAVCSKNAPEIAATGFAHPSSRLAMTDFASVQCSWNDKAAGLRAIAAELNVGLDTIVLVDDNPAECALVQQLLPEVATLCLGQNPADFAALLDDRHWFDAQAITAEDTARTQSYSARRQATQAAQTAQSEGDIESYLASLEMVGQLSPATEADVPRIAQLEQKTNQFNATTRRYSEADIRGFMARDDAWVTTLRLSDRFGAHGLVSSLIAVQTGTQVRIESWLMSCRVFSRTAEQFILDHLLQAARARGAETLVVDDRPTAKNGVIATLWPQLGFHKQADEWHRPTAAAPPKSFIGSSAP